MPINQLWDLGKLLALPQPLPRDEPYGLDLQGISVCKMIHVTKITDRTTVLDILHIICAVWEVILCALTFLSKMGLIGLVLSVSS